MSTGNPIRVFLSSTGEDLQPERDAVEKALHRMRDTVFGGMEYFGSRPETTREVSLAEVDRSHVYIGIFAHRYGSGITEAEYRRARERGIPCLIYLKDESVPVPPAHIERKRQKARRLERLKRELKGHHAVSFFKSPDNLATQVVTDLHKHLDSAPTVEEEGKPLPKGVTEEPEGRPAIGCSLTVFLSLIVSIAACIAAWLVVPEVRQLLPVSPVTPISATPAATATPTPGGLCAKLEVPAFLIDQREVSGTVHLSAPAHLSPKVILSPEGCKAELVIRWFSDGKAMPEYDDFQTIPLNPQYLSAEQTLRVVIYIKPIGELEVASIRIVVSK